MQFWLQKTSFTKASICHVLFKTQCLCFPLYLLYDFDLGVIIVHVARGLPSSHQHTAGELSRLKYEVESDVLLVWPFSISTHRSPCCFLYFFRWSGKVKTCSTWCVALLVWGRPGSLDSDTQWRTRTPGWNQTNGWVDQQNSWRSNCLETFHDVKDFSDTRWWNHLAEYRLFVCSPKFGILGLKLMIVFHNHLNPWIYF